MLTLLEALDELIQNQKVNLRLIILKNLQKKYLSNLCLI